MSKLIYVCNKDPRLNSRIKKDIERISVKLVPDNITPRPVKIVEEDGIVYGIVNPVNVLEENGSSVLLGKAFSNTEKWWMPGQNYPDGSYALFRGGSDSVELVSDASGSRSIWYYHDEHQLIASTSQRAVVSLLKSFSFNKNVLPWILSTGGPGPGNSWDSRIQLLPPDSSLNLNRETWTLEVKTNPIEFEPVNLSDDKQKELLRKALEETFQPLNFDYKDWVLPLSGGYDSRSILCLLKNLGKGITGLQAITWGLKTSIYQKDNDAYIAKELAEYYKIDHKYYSTDLAAEPIETVFERFLICGEGRIDHVGGYLDGFKIWKTLYEDNIQGIIRGDIGFSSVPADSQFAIRKRLGIALCSDYANLKNYQEWGFPNQELPEYLKIRDTETLAMWRDRLYHEYRMPTVLAALSDFKLPYVEIANPLLSRKILYQIRKLADHLRNNKSLFKSIAESISPSIPYAASGANARVKDVLKTDEAVKLLKKELSSEYAESIFPSGFITYILDNLKGSDAVSKEKKSVKSIIKRYAPKWLKNKLLNAPIKNNIDYNLLAFRMFIACRMYNLLHKDAVLNQEISEEPLPL